MATIILVPLGTYPAQARSFEHAIPAGITQLNFQIHAPVQAAFSYQIDFSTSTDDGATWALAASAGCSCTATASEVQVDGRAPNRVKADLTLATPMTGSVTLVTS